MRFVCTSKDMWEVIANLEELNVTPPPPLGILPGTYGVLTVSDRQAPRGVPGGNWGDPEYGMIKTSPEGSRQLGKGRLKKYAALGQFGIRKRG